MNIETPEDLAEWLADKFGVFGCCKSDGDKCPPECKDKNNPFCCRIGFMQLIPDRIRESVENEKKLESLTFKK